MLSKRTYLFVLLLLSCGFLINKSITNFFGSIFLVENILLILQWLWLIYGLVMFKNRRLKSNSILNRRIAYIFIVLIILSTLYPYFNYDQSIFDTLIAHRFNYSIISLLILLRMGIEDKDVKKVICSFGFISSFLFFISMLVPEFFLVDKDSNSVSTDLGAGILTPGSFFVLLSFYIYVDRTISDSKHIFTSSIAGLYMLGVIIMMQNRQMILISIPIFLYALLLKANVKTKLISSLVLLIALLIFYTSATSILEDLYQETYLQIYDPNYPRIKALKTYVLNYNFEVWPFLFGHGIGAGNSDYLIYLNALNRNGIFFQDIGFIGVFYVYGLLFVLLNFNLIRKGCFKKGMPRYIRFWCLGILVVPIFQYWGLMNNQLNMVFVLLFYLIMANESLIPERINAEYNYYKL